jgi:hypothetical protein
VLSKPLDFSSYQHRDQHIELDEDLINMSEVLPDLSIRLAFRVQSSMTGVKGLRRDMFHNDTRPAPPAISSLHSHEKLLSSPLRASPAGRRGDLLTR